MKKKKKRKKEKKIFSRVFDIANQLLSRQSPFAPLVQVDEWTAKSLRFSFGRDFVGLWLIKCWKTVSLTESDVQTFLEPKYENKNWNLRFQWLWWQHLIISTEIDIVRFATGRFQPSTSKISSFSKEKVDLWEILHWKLRLLSFLWPFNALFHLEP